MHLSDGAPAVSPRACVLERGRAARLALASSLALLVACGDGRSDPNPPPPPPPDPCALSTPGAPWIAFASNRTGDYDIWRARVDGSCFAQVTHDPAADLSPTWSRTSIAFASERGGALRLWTSELATGAEAQLDTGDLVRATSPAFSPAGDRIAFEGRAPGAVTSDVYVMDAAGGAPVALASDAADDAGPAWSPDGETIYFVSTRSGRYEIWAVPAAGGRAVQVTTGSRILGKPAVAPDGTSVAYARTVEASSHTEVVLRVIATSAVSVVSSFDDSEPTFAPGGTSAPISMRSFRTGHADIVLVGLRGEAPTALTDDVASDGAPAFAPLP